MNGTAAAGGGGWKGWPGGGRGITGTGWGLGFPGRARPQLGMRVLLLIPPIMFGIAVAVLLADHSTGFRQQVVLALVLVAAGFVVGRLTAGPALLGLRNLARLTRRLLGSWAGIPVAESYLPQPRPAAPRLPYLERLSWLTSGPATRRDPGWCAVH